MRCEEIQKRLNEFSSQTPELSPEIREHLNRCETCSRLAESAFKLDQIFQAAANEPESELMPLETRIKRVTHEAELSGWIGRMDDLAVRLTDAVSFGHRRLILSIGMVALVLAFVTLVPFGYNRVVSYDLTLGGVCPEVAEDQETACALLYERGVERAVIDVMQCDTTCSLVLFDLQSEQEIDMVIETYIELGAEATIEHIAVITDRDSRSLLHLAHERIFNN